MLKLSLHHKRFESLFFSKPTPLLSPSSHFYKRAYVTYQGRIPTKGVDGARETRRFNVVFNGIRDSGEVVEEEKTVAVKAIISVKRTFGGLLSNITLSGGLDVVSDFFGKDLLLELISSELNSDGSEKKRITGYGHKEDEDGDDIKFECTFDVPTSFGEIGAIRVENQYHKEMYLIDIVLSSSSTSPVTFTCNSWISSKSDNSTPRIFFGNKCYLPSDTPGGLKKSREVELQNLRGDGTGKRKSSDRIYDYDKYNDLGNPDLSDELARPVLGGPEHPYPRRCRTGRGSTKKDPLSEKWSLSMYVPRDEAFSEAKELQFTATAVKEVLNALHSSSLFDIYCGFPDFTAIDEIFKQGMRLPKLENQGLLESIVTSISDHEILDFDTPELFRRDRFSWLEDEEFARQTLAGVNPYSIQLITEWPLKSKLDQKIYGPSESAITKELLEQELEGMTTVDEALKQKKLFILDYHDLLLPYVTKVRAMERTTLYGSRTIFFLREDNVLRPLAIELTRPPMEDKPQWKKVFTPGYTATAHWLWKFAKVHVCAHESAYHELVVHWLRTHASIEPYIIATNRQLSAMHPIYRLLHPHLRYTMEINVRARKNLINAGGIIESTFSLGKYSMELSSVAYDQTWRFDMEALPADLIRRGMAVEDPSEAHGLKLTIQDYPFANDGLLVWDAIKTWISAYVNHYYPEARMVENDSELQMWWTEIRTKGHEDKKDEPWWPILKTPADLIQILATIVWVASCHHAAVNFGQYTYGGYFPNRPSIARTNMPTEDPTAEDYKKFSENPESALLECFPSQIQATLVMAVLKLLSTHSTDEEYLGDQIEPSWLQNPVIKEAFERFNKKLIEIDGTIDARNADPKLVNRTGVGVVPYELLKPFSKPGATGMGVPNSTSI